MPVHGEQLLERSLENLIPGCRCCRWGLRGLASSRLQQRRGVDGGRLKRDGMRGILNLNIGVRSDDSLIGHRLLTYRRATDWFIHLPDEREIHTR